MTRAERRVAWKGAVDWLAYLVVSAALGGAWTVILAGMGLVRFETRSEVGLETAWAILTGVVIGSFARLGRMRMGVPVSLWNALLLPTAGCVIHYVLTRLFGTRVTDKDVSELALMLLYSYTCGGLLILPLAALNLYALTKVDPWVTRVLDGWKGRRIRHAAYGLACVPFLVGGEIGRAMDRVTYEDSTWLSNRLGIQLPDDAVVLNPSLREPTPTHGVWWVRADTFDLTTDQVFVKRTLPEPTSSIVDRARRAGIETDGYPFVTQLKHLNAYPSPVYANLVLTAKAQYMEIIVSPP